MNIAYIDNQNLYMATHYADEPWDIDMRKFRKFLKDRYDVETAYLFMGAFGHHRQTLYQTFMSFGYILDFRPHGLEMLAHKKGNVDTDIVFSMMRDYHESDNDTKAILVSGDGDYFRTVEYLLDRGRFETVLFPSHKNASSLYKQLSNKHFAYLDTSRVKSALKRK